MNDSPKTPDEPTYAAVRYQGRTSLAEVIGSHKIVVGVVQMVWGSVPDSLMNDLDEPDEKGEWKFHLGGEDWLVVSR